MEGCPVKIQRLERVKRGRLIAISDIHGHAGWLRRLLEEVRPTHQDEVFIVGDLIERGSENLEALRLVMALWRQGAHVCRGNWDLHVLRLVEDERAAAEMLREGRSFVRRFGNSLLDDFMRGAGVSADWPAQRAQRAVQEAYAPELEFLRGLPDIIETPHRIFVHGGLPHERLSELEGCPAAAFLKNDCFLEQGISFKKFLMVGHTPARSYTEGVICHAPHIHRGQRIASIDGGCGVLPEGQLNAVISPGEASEEFSWISADDFPLIRALDDQQASQHALTVHWPHNGVEVLSREAEGLWLKHSFSGRTLFARENELYHQADGAHLMDKTDYCLPVQAGERLKLIRLEQNGRALVKGRGVVGWYLGRYERIES